MLRYKLRTLLIVLALGPPLIWAAWMTWNALRPRPPVEKPIYYSHRFQFDVF